MARTDPLSPSPRSRWPPLLALAAPAPHRRRTTQTHHRHRPRRARGTRRGRLRRRCRWRTRRSPPPWSAQTTLRDSGAAQPGRPDAPRRRLSATPTTPRATGASSSVRGFTLDNRFNYRRDGLPINAETVDRARTTRQRIEVLKGTSGIQAGTSAPGGLVNLVVKRPDDAPCAAPASKRARAAAARWRVDLGERFGDGDAFGLRVNAAYEDLDPQTRNADGHRCLAALAADWRLPRGTLLEAEVESQPPAAAQRAGLQPARRPVPDAERDRPAHQPQQPAVVAAGGVRRQHRLAAHHADACRPTGAARLHAMTQRLTHRRPHRLPVRLQRRGRASTATAATAASTSTTSAATASSAAATRSTSASKAASPWPARTHHCQRRRARHALRSAAAAAGLQLRRHRQRRRQRGRARRAAAADRRDQPQRAQHRAVPARPRRARAALEPVARPAPHAPDTAAHRRHAPRLEQSFTTPWLALAWQAEPQTLLYASWGKGVECDVAPNLPRTPTPAALPALKSRQLEAGLKHARDGIEWSLAAFDDHAAAVAATSAPATAATAAAPAPSTAAPCTAASKPARQRSRRLALAGQRAAAARAARRLGQRRAERPASRPTCRRAACACSRLRRAALPAPNCRPALSHEGHAHACCPTTARASPRGRGSTSARSCSSSWPAPRSPGAPASTT